MKKTKRVLALSGAVLLICLYVSTLIFAIFDRSVSADLLKVSVAATIFLPVLLYAYGLIYRLSQNKRSNDTDEEP